MCDPLTITGAVLTGASMAANMSAQSRVDRARSDAMAAERIRQQGFDRETDALNLRSQDRYEDFGGQQDEKSKSLGDYFKGQTTSDGGAPAPAGAREQSLMPASNSQITVQNEAAKRGEAKKFTDQQGEALGGLRSFGDLLGGIGRSQARDAGYIGQIGGFKKGSSNVLGLELEEANSAGGGMKMLGDILGGLGKLGMSAGLSGGFGLSDTGNGSFMNPFLEGSPQALAAAKAPTFAGNVVKAAGGSPNMPMVLGVGAGALPTFARGNSPYRVF